jgi:aryl-alcohol dehydrogenase-like predicted oxidoreductase
MRYKLFGRSGLRVSELCLGTMTFGEDWGWGASKAESRKIFDLFAEAGGNFIDTASRYTEGTSEKFVGEFVAADREHFVVATKYTLFSRRNDPNASGNHRKNLRQSLEASLKRLNMDHVDVLWVHAWDFMTPVEEVLRALDDLVRAGKVLYLGISNTPAWIVSQANTLAGFLGWSPFVGLQIEYSLIERGPERDLLPMARAFDLAVTPFSVLASGALSGKYNQPGAADGDRAARWGRTNERNMAVAAEVVAIAAEAGCTPAQVAMNWVRQQPGVMIPIVGARSEAQARDNLACLSYSLTEAQLQRLDDVSRSALGYPLDFLAGAQDSIYGGTLAQIDNHRRQPGQPRPTQA